MKNHTGVARHVREEQVLSFLENKLHGMKLSEISHFCGIGNDRCMEIIVPMHASGLLTKIGGAGSTRWCLFKHKDTCAEHLEKTRKHKVKVADAQYQARRRERAKLLRDKPIQEFARKSIQRTTTQWEPVKEVGIRWVFDLCT